MDKPELYSEEELDILEAFIDEHFGKCQNVFHEIASPDIHVDIYIIDPTPARNYYTLVTLGMGAHRMNVPEELAEYKLERAELAISLPADWKLPDKDERWYWPIRWLKVIARLPIEEDSWVGWGHTVGNPADGPLAEGTDFAGFILLNSGGFACHSEDADVCTLPDGSEVNFYDIVPLYGEEIDFKLKYHSAEALLGLMKTAPETVPLMPVDVQRKNVCAPENLATDWAREYLASLGQKETAAGEDSSDSEEEDDIDYSAFLMDAADVHLESLREKHLPVDELMAYAHLAHYLRWCIEHDLMAEYFRETERETVEAVKRGDSSVDLRAFLRDHTDGLLARFFFNDEGAAFAEYYYGKSDGHYYPADVDDCALHYFGEERYHCAEFQDEAYLFTPYDEDYYQRIASYIDRRWQQWREEQAAQDAPAGPLLRDEDIAALERLCEGISGYFGKMISYLDDFVERGVKEGRFTEEQAHADLDIALWYAYACLNYDEYETYYMATQWMPASEQNAKGCGTWYYRYSCALMYCGKLKAALEYAEKGAVEQPDYPWIWLQLGKMRAHFGDKAGALDAVERGLALEPGDHEFLTLRGEIEAGRNLEEMNYHFIDPTSDWQLQNGILDETAQKQSGVASILCNEKRLAQIKELFRVSDWDTDGPYCAFHFPLGGQEVEGLFRMNEAALSKLDASRLAKMKAHLARHCLQRRVDGHTFRLAFVAINRDYSVDLQYQDQDADHLFGLRNSKADNAAERSFPDPAHLDTALSNALKQAEQDAN